MVKAHTMEEATMTTGIYIVEVLMTETQLQYIMHEGSGKINVHITERHVAELRQRGRVSLELPMARPTKQRPTDGQLVILFLSGKSSRQLARETGENHMWYERAWRRLGLDTSVPARDRWQLGTKETP